MAMANIDFSIKINSKNDESNKTPASSTKETETSPTVSSKGSSSSQYTKTNEDEKTENHSAQQASASASVDSAGSAAKGKTAKPEERPFVTLLVGGTPIRIELLSSSETAVPPSSSSSTSKAPESDTKAPESDTKGSPPRTPKSDTTGSPPKNSESGSEPKTEKTCSPKIFQRGFLKHQKNKFLSTNSEFKCSYKSEHYGWDFGFSKGTNLASESTSADSSKGKQKEAKGSFSSNLNVRGVTVDLTQIIMVVVLVAETVARLFGGKSKPSTD